MENADLVIALLLAGCATEPVIHEVKVPVPVMFHVPAELLAPQPVAQGPIFVAPGAPGVIAGVTQDGAKKLQDLVNDLRARLAAWQA